MKAQIAIDGTSALAQGGGIGRFTRGLLQGLGACDRESAYEILYMRDASAMPPFELPANFRWQRIPLTQKQAVWFWHRLRLPLPAELWLKQRPDLFHSPDYTLPPLRWARGIVTVHDLSFEVLPEVHDPKLRRYLQQAVPRSIRRADHVFADSESTREEIVRHYGTNPAKISVVYPGVEPRFRPLSREHPEEARLLDEVRTRYKLERPFLLSVGTLEPRKNLTTLIRAFASYHTTGDHEVALVIAGGSGWLGQRESLEALVASLGLTAHVQFLGFVEDAQLPALLNLARALLYPSLYEGFGLPVLEAMACGIPVVTAHNTSLPEAGGTAARYIEVATEHEALAAELHRVLHDEAERQRMSRAGLVHAAQFTWEATARQVMSLYEQVL